MPAIPILAAVGGGSALAGGLTLGSTALGAYSTIKGMNDAKNAANQAQQAAQQAQVNIPQVSQMATDQALKNIALSRDVEQQYFPENAALRSNSILGLLAQLGQNPNSAISDQLMAQFQGGTNTYGGSIADKLAMAQGGGPVVGRTADSSLLNDAIAKAQSDLALGGNIPLEIRNLVARTAAGKSGAVTGGLGLGRDITARDLGTTGLALAQQRLAAAQALGQAQLGGAQFNAQLGQSADTTNAQLAQALSQFNAGQRNAGLQFDSSQLQQANQFGVGNNLNLAQLMSQLNGQDFSKYLATAQFGQSLQAPVVGLDPSSIANLAVGNSNAASQAGMNAAGIKAQSGNNLTNFGGQLFGYGFGNLGDVFKTNNFQTGGYNNPTLASKNGASGAGIPSYYGF